MTVQLESSRKLPLQVEMIGGSLLRQMALLTLMVDLSEMVTRHLMSLTI